MTLERVFFCYCLSARAAVGTLEREFPSLSILDICRKFWESASGARADIWTLEREPVSVRSSGVLYARAELFISDREIILFDHFLISFLFLTFSNPPLESTSLLNPNFSLRIDLVGVVFSPWAFTKIVLIVEGYLLI